MNTSCICIPGYLGTQKEIMNKNMSNRSEFKIINCYENPRHTKRNNPWVINPYHPRSKDVQPTYI